MCIAVECRTVCGEMWRAVSDGQVAAACWTASCSLAVTRTGSTECRTTGKKRPVRRLSMCGSSAESADGGAPQGYAALLRLFLDAHGGATVEYHVRTDRPMTSETLAPVCRASPEGCGHACRSRCRRRAHSDRLNSAGKDPSSGRRSAWRDGEHRWIVAGSPALERREMQERADCANRRLRCGRVVRSLSRCSGKPAPATHPGREARHSAVFPR